MNRFTCLGSIYFKPQILGLNLVDAALCLLFVGSLFSPANAQDAVDTNCNDLMTQQDMNFCAHQNLEAADGELNAVYRKVESVMAAKDARLAINSPELTGAVEALVNAQRGWITYRNAHCRAYGFGARGGTMERFLVSSCLAELTRARTKELLSLINNSPI